MVILLMLIIICLMIKIVLYLWNESKEMDKLIKELERDVYEKSDS